MPNTLLLQQSIKHPFLLCQLLGWSLYIVFIYLAYGVEAQHSLEHVLLYYLSEMLLGLGLTCLLKYPLTQLMSCRVWWLVAGALGLTFFTAYLWTWLKVGVFYALFDLLAHQSQAHTIQVWLPNSLSIIASWCAIYVAFHYGSAHAQQEKALLILSAKANEDKLKMLRYQLNPHFLFNTLASIRALVSDTDKHKARAMILELSDLLRYNLYADPLALHPLHEELKVLQAYINIERVRFGERLQIESQMSEQSQRVMVPGMLLQPLFENIIKHSLTYSIAPIQVEMQARIEADMLNLVLQNTCPAQGTPSQLAGQKGIGLNNTRARLAHFYGQRASLEAGFITNEGVFVHDLKGQNAPCTHSLSHPQLHTHSETKRYRVQIRLPIQCSHSANSGELE